MTDQLISITGISARIHNLPGREPFMLAADLAAAYGTEYRRVTEAVKRNPGRFPEDFAFYLTEAEAEALKSQNAVSNREKWSQNATTSGKRLPQNAATSPGRRTDLRQLVFTHGGAVALSAVLKTQTAVEVSNTVFRAFVAMEKAAHNELRYRLEKAQMEVKASNRLFLRIIDGADKGWTFEAIWRAGSASKPKLTEAVRDLFARGLIDRLPEGTPLPELDLFSAFGGQHG